MPACSICLKLPLENGIYTDVTVVVVGIVSRSLQYLLHWGSWPHLACIWLNDNVLVSCLFWTQNNRPISLSLWHCFPDLWLFVRHCPVIKTILRWWPSSQGFWSVWKSELLHHQEIHSLSTFKLAMTAEPSTKKCQNAHSHVCNSIKLKANAIVSTIVWQCML